MGRLVRKPTLPGAEPAQTGGGDFGGMFQTQARTRPTAEAGAGGDNATMAGFSVTSIAVLALIAGLIFTPVFCWYVREDGDAWITNAVVSTIAFPFWSYLMGAVAFTKFHDGNLAVILILTFTAVSGLVTPVLDRPKQQEQISATPKEGPRLVESLTA